MGNNREPDEHKPMDAEEVRVLKHDIRNQLSNIIMSVEQLRYELTNVSDDCAFYLNTLTDSCSKINSLLDNKGE